MIFTVITIANASGHAQNYDSMAYKFCVSAVFSFPAFISLKLSLTY